ncbi:MAG: hypothetical protein M1838_005838 [Thelocarpon superellum]|nr:MAG: hypothetical protein M1838_005838 [Thelocarpon superellum]
MTETQCTELGEGPVSFRPGKRRKVYRKRADEDEDVAVVATTTTTDAAAVHAHDMSSQDRRAGAVPSHQRKHAEEGEAENTALHISEIVRLRRQAKQRRGGLEFGAGQTSAAAHSHASGMALVSAPPTTHGQGETVGHEDEVMEDVASVTNRFAPQTGQVADVNKHMIAFIDAELAKRRRGDLSQSSASAVPDEADASHRDGMNAPPNPSPSGTRDHLQRQPASLGKLHEIDLGPNATLSNIARTEAARRRMEGQMMEGEEDEEEKAGKRKIRIGKDGKPYRPKRRQARRTSEDMRRDRLVEEVLRESRPNGKDVAKWRSTTKQQVTPDSTTAGPEKQTETETAVQGGEKKRRKKEQTTVSQSNSGGNSWTLSPRVNDGGLGPSLHLRLPRPPLVRKRVD